MSKAVVKKNGANRMALDQAALLALFTEEQGEIYRRVISEARVEEIRFALGGGFAVNAYTGLRRNTKDLDIYVSPDDREAMIAILTRAGLSDYYDQQPYDRAWIYRGYLEGTIVDVIWEMANHHARVDDEWLTRGPEASVEGLRLKLLPPEELIWSKLYVLQRDRCDWPDVFNLLHVAGAALDWEWLLGRVGEDAALLAGALSVFGWLCPARARLTPPWVWRRLGLSRPAPGDAPEVDCDHVNLIDSRPWFRPALTPEEAQ
jgi:hypothetical protein